MNDIGSPCRRHGAPARTFRKTGRIRRIALAASLILLCTASAPATDLLPLLPKDTLAAVAITNVPELGKAWDSTPLGQAARDPRLAPIIKPFEKKIADLPNSIENELGVSFDTVKQLTSGGAALFLTRFEWSTVDVYEFDTCFLAEIRPEEHERVRTLVEKLLEKTPVDARRSRYTFKGQAVYVIQFNQKIDTSQPRYDRRTGKTIVATPQPGSPLATVEEVPIVIEYTLMGKYLIACEGRNEPIRKIITALKDPSESLGQTSGYRRVSESLGGTGTISAWMDAGRVWNIYSGHKHQMNKKVDLSKLGLQDVGGMLLRLRLNADAISFDGAVETPKSPTGVLAMFLQPGRDNPLKTSSLCPSNATSYSSVLFDGQKVWTGLRSLLIQYAPQVWGFINMQISQYDRMFGIDLVRGIIGTLGGELAVYRREPPSLRKRFSSAGRFGSMTILVGLRDGKTFRQNHERMFQVLTGEPYQLPIRKTTYLNFDIWHFKQDPNAPRPTVPAWTLTDDYLIISSDSEEIPGVLRAYVGKGESSLADDPGFKRALKQFPQPDRISFSYTPAGSIPDVVQPLLYFLSRWTSENFEPSRKILDPGVKQALSRHIGSLAGATYVEPRILRTHSRLSAAKP